MPPGITQEKMPPHSIGENSVKGIVVTPAFSPDTLCYINLKRYSHLIWVKKLCFILGFIIDGIDTGQYLKSETLWHKKQWIRRNSTLL